MKFIYEVCLHSLGFCLNVFRLLYIVIVAGDLSNDYSLISDFWSKTMMDCAVVWSFKKSVGLSILVGCVVELKSKHMDLVFNSLSAYSSQST